MNILILLLYYW